MFRSLTFSLIKRTLQSPNKFKFCRSFFFFQVFRDFFRNYYIFDIHVMESLFASWKFSLCVFSLFYSFVSVRRFIFKKLRNLLGDAYLFQLTEALHYGQVGVSVQRHVVREPSGGIDIVQILLLRTVELIVLETAVKGRRVK